MKTCTGRPRAARVWLTMLLTAVLAAEFAPSARGQNIDQKGGVIRPQPPIPLTKPGRPAPPPPQPAPIPPGAPEVDDGPVYRVSQFVLHYAKDNPQLPRPEEILQATVQLGRISTGFVAPREGVQSFTIRLEEVGREKVESFHFSALAIVVQAISNEYSRRGIMGTLVTMEEDIAIAPADPNYRKDLRPAGQTALRVLVRTGIVTKVRTLAFGDRIPVKDRVDNPKHDRIREMSPVQPAASPDDPNRQDLLDRNAIDDYVYRLNRHPGRRVDVAVGSAGEPGTVSLDYLVTENRPWLVYGQVSNTGTKQTNQWRERFGFQHNQLTGHDDVLSLDYITAGFDVAHAVVGSYEAPLFRAERLRWRAYGSWNQFTASDVGAANETFTGSGYAAGGELVANVFQHHEFFIDVVGGARWQHIEVNNEVTGNNGASDFFMPYVGLRAERDTDTATTRAMVNLETNVPGVAGTDQDQLLQMGRVETSDDWVAMQWDVSQSFYLEPLINRTAWEDTSDKGHPMLAHEIALSFKGQYAFGDRRLIPNMEQVLGGLYTVRGYPESVVAGDTILVGSVEYRYHIPRGLRYDSEPKGMLFGQPFRWRPSQPYGRADWDLIVRGFLDAGRAINSNISVTEHDETLVGAGVGVEFLFKRNLSLRVDWGVALHEVQDPKVTEGSNRFHIVATILF